MNFYKHFIGDYQRDTGHLSLMEHGAYRLMLDIFYATQRPLPKDRKTLYRLLRAETMAEKRAIDSVVSQFWRASARGLSNLRAAAEIGKAKKQAEVNSQIACAREEKKRLAKQLPESSKAKNAAFSSGAVGVHGVFDRGENRVCEVSKADGSSIESEKQAINGVKMAKRSNKDSFMATLEEEGGISGSGAMFTAACLAKAMCASGVQAQSADPRLMALAGQGISPETVAAACDEAKRTRPGERIGIVYVVRIVERWAKEAAAIAAHGAKGYRKTGAGGVHAERKRVMEELTGRRMDDSDAALMTVEGRARILDGSVAAVVAGWSGGDEDGALA